MRDRGYGPCAAVSRSSSGGESRGTLRPKPPRQASDYDRRREHCSCGASDYYRPRQCDKAVVCRDPTRCVIGLFAVEGVASVGRTSREAAAAGAGRCGCCSSASARWLTMPDRNAAPKLTKSAATATTTIVHIRPASTSPPASAGSRVRASSTIAMKGMTPLIAPITLKAMMPARLRAPGRRTTPASSRRRFVPHPSRLPRTVESDRS